jgi:hypothetical protein
MRPFSNLKTCKRLGLLASLLPDKLEELKIREKNKKE